MILVPATPDILSKAGLTTPSATFIRFVIDSLSVVKKIDIIGDELLSYFNTTGFSIFGSPKLIEPTLSRKSLIASSFGLSNTNCTITIETF